MKRTIWQSILFSVSIHALFFIGIVGTGFFQTKMYEPNIAQQSYQNVTYLQNEVVFGQSFSSVYYIVTGILVACMFILIKQLFIKIKGIS